MSLLITPQGFYFWHEELDYFPSESSFTLSPQGTTDKHKNIIRDNKINTLRPPSCLNWKNTESTEMQAGNWEWRRVFSYKFDVKFIRLFSSNVSPTHRRFFYMSFSFVQTPPIVDNWMLAHRLLNAEGAISASEMTQWNDLRKHESSRHG